MNTELDNTSIVYSEEDVPFNAPQQNNTQQPPIAPLPLTEQKIKNAERKAKMNKDYAAPIYRSRGFWLMVGCLGAYLFLVIFDSLISFNGHKISDLGGNFVELLKFVVSTLIGFVFSENLKNDNDSKNK